MKQESEILEIGDVSNGFCQVLGNTPACGFSATYNVRRKRIVSVSVYPRKASKRDAKRIGLELIAREPVEHFAESAK
jgi:hypothetical protein